MNQEANVLELERQTYLLVLARKLLDRRLWHLIGPEDVVQQTLLDAHRKREQFAGKTEGEWRSWLRTMLLHDVADAIRKYSPINQREKTVQDALDRSSCRIEAMLAADQTSPTQAARDHEELQRLADALAKLPERWRVAVELHHLHGWSQAELADYMKSTPPAVAGLLYRALERLRELLHE